jgi:hypothetical protein
MNRVARLDHIERLGFVVGGNWNYYDDGVHEIHDYESVKIVTDPLLKVIDSDPNLTCLDRSNSSWLLDWGPRFKRIFKTMEGHSKLCTFVVVNRCYCYWSCYWPSDNSTEHSRYPRFSWLEQLLSRNRNITVWKGQEEGAQTEQASTLLQWISTACERYYTMATLTGGKDVG